MKQSTSPTELLPHLHQRALSVSNGTCALLFVHNARTGAMHATSGYGLEAIPTDPWIPAPPETVLLKDAFFPVRADPSDQCRATSARPLCPDRNRVDSVAAVAERNGATRVVGHRSSARADRPRPDGRSISRRRRVRYRARSLSLAPERCTTAGHSCACWTSLRPCWEPR